MGKLVDVFTGLFNKFDSTEKRYEEALEKKQEELIAVGTELAEKEKMFKDLERMYLLNDVSKETFDAEKEKIDNLKTRIKEIETEMGLIEEYKTDDLKTVLEELEATGKELSAGQQAEIFALKKSLIQAKYNYLKTIVEARKKYVELVTPNLKVEQLKDKLGIKNRLYYQSGAYDALHLYSANGRSYINLEVKTKDIHDALQYGRIDGILSQEVKAEK